MGEGQGSPKAEMKHTPGEGVPHLKDEEQQDSEMSGAPKWLNSRDSKRCDE